MPIVKFRLKAIVQLSISPESPSTDALHKQLAGYGVTLSPLYSLLINTII